MHPEYNYDDTAKFMMKIDDSTTVELRPGMQTIEFHSEEDLYVNEHIAAQKKLCKKLRRD
ncbi:hypothetical protein TIMEGRIFFIN_169 [Bacillus phage vB_BspH_TimeGriffin]|nr:hypothetical protein TIMEGRIFFIN_169 [Bacillus phage vB_BspH_TimeGriffin]